MAGKYLIRTFGCQMNDHDSERLAGLLEADGMVPTDDVEEADVVVLNTCCIRENADNKLYGHLGHLKSVKDRHPGMQIAVGGCLAQKDRDLIQQRAPQVDAVFGTHNVGRAAELLREAADGGPAGHGDPRRGPAPRRRRPPCPCAATCRTPPGSPSRSAATTRAPSASCPSVRGKEISRPFDEIVAEVRGAGRGRHRRGHPPGPERQLLRPRPHPAAGRCSPTCCGRSASVDGIRRVRYTSPHPKDLRPETIAAMAEVAGRVRAPPPARSSRAATGCWPPCTGATPAARYLERLAAARAAVPDLAVTTDLIVGFPGETDDDFERTLEVVAEAEYDSAYTFLFSPRPGTEAAELPPTGSSPADVAAERFERLRVVVERSALAKHQARVGRIEEVLVEGPSKRDPSVATGRTRQNKLVHFPVGRRRAGRGHASPTSRITGAAPHHLPGELVEVTARPRHRTRIPVAVV